MNSQRVLRSWNTIVPLKRCPECGQSDAPDPMMVLRDLVEASEHLWGICPAYRRRKTIAPLDVVREAS